jgi:hypothetical protein
MATLPKRCPGSICDTLPRLHHRDRPIHAQDNLPHLFFFIELMLIEFDNMYNKDK